jgi:lactoylglutathione lyase
MKLGAFSISLAVSDLGKSRAFYEELGFGAVGGDADQGWLIMRNDAAIVGLFQGMFEKNILTFNPGWDMDANELDSYTDIREIQRRLLSRGVQLETTADEASTGPASITLLDPDGNPVLIDQHV